MGEKSLFVAYLLWIIGGWFALHLLYLRRDKQAFIYWCSFGGYFGCGIMRDFFQLSTLVKDANDDTTFVEKITQQMKKYNKPRWSLVRMMAQIMVGNMWTLLMSAAVPRSDLLFGYSLEPLKLALSPLAAAIAVWMIGNIGREQGSMKWAVMGSYITVIGATVYSTDILNWSSVPSMLVFNLFSKRWRRTPYNKRKLLSRVTTLSVGWLVFCGLFCSFLYFNATLESKGEKIKFRDAIGNFIKSPMFQEFKSNVRKVADDAWKNGITEAWANCKELLDPTGRYHALKILELPKNASETDIKDRARSLSKQWHPDKHSEKEKDEAQAKFMAVQEAYKILLNSKRKRARHE